MVLGYTRGHRSHDQSVTGLGNLGALNSAVVFEWKELKASEFEYSLNLYIKGNCS